MIRKLKSYLPSRYGIMGINARNLEMIYTHNPRRNFPKVDDKLLCKDLMRHVGIPVAATYHVVTGPATLAEWPERMLGQESFVIKPNCGYGGNGILLVKCKDGLFVSSGEVLAREDIDFHIKQILNGTFSLDNTSDTAYFEQKLANHPGIQAFIPIGIDGVADIRLIYQHERPVMAMLRLPTQESQGKANLHQGGLGVGIDLATGLSLNGCYRNTVITAHPETKEALAGRPIPHFGEMLAYGSRISEVVGLGYIGVDFVCDRDSGPMLLEVNARPGLNIQIANQAGLRARIR